MEQQTETIIQKILNYKISIRQRIRFNLITFGASMAWLLIKELIKYRRHRNILLLAKSYILKRNQEIANLKFDLPDFSQEKMEKILNADVAELKQMLKANEVSSVNLVNIFSHRCREIGMQLNCITVFNYEDSIQIATNLDEQRLKDPNIVDTKLLYGIPISIKDFIEQKNLPCTVGCINRLNRIPTEDGLTINLVKHAGGIPFVKTNIPQLGMSFESANRIYGTTLNPWDRTRYPGGSSGGEAACVASRCSPLGIGSDLGGSIRSPACFNGLYGFKPTSGRIPFQGFTKYSPTQSGETNVKTAMGPICKNIDDCILLMNVLNQDVLKDMKLHKSMMHQLYLPFDQKQLTNTSVKHKIGYFKTYEVFDASIANQRAVDITVNTLRELGHEVVEIEIPHVERLVYIFLEMASADNLKGFDHQLGDEDYIDVYKPTLRPFHLSIRLKKFISFILRRMGENRKAKILSQMKKNLLAEEYLRNVDEIMTIRKEVVQYLEDLDISAVICPCFAAPALKHTDSAKVVFATSYLYIWNVLNFPAGVLPITEVQEDEQHYNNTRIKDSMSSVVHQSMQGTAKLPINVQVVTLPNRDELCLNLMKQIDEKIQFYKNRKLPL